MSGEDSTYLRDSNARRYGGPGYSQRPPVGRLSTGKGYPCDLVSQLDFRRFSSPILVFKELLNEVLGGL